jgi:hypothetical protein
MKSVVATWSCSEVSKSAFITKKSTCFVIIGVSENSQFPCPVKSFQPVFGTSCKPLTSAIQNCDRW